MGCRNHYSTKYIITQNYTLATTQSAPITRFDFQLVKVTRISRKDRNRIRQQIGLEETIIKETEQNQLTWYGHVRRMAEGRLPKNSIEVDAKTKDSTRKTEEKLDGRN